MRECVERCRRQDDLRAIVLRGLVIGLSIRTRKYVGCGYVVAEEPKPTNALAKVPATPPKFETRENDVRPRTQRRDVAAAKRHYRATRRCAMVTEEPLLGSFREAQRLCAALVHAIAVGALHR